MHCVLTADLAALLSHHGPAILQRREMIPADALVSYWAASKSRFELWHRSMARYRHCEQTSDSDALRRWWHEHVVVMEEVLVTDMLTRVVAALACGLEAETQQQEMVPVTHAIHLSHLEARNRVQKIMLFGRGNSVHDSIRLNRLRQGVERWTDAMIGRMPMQCDAMLQYAIDPDRAAEYASEVRGYGHGDARRTATWLMNAAMHDLLRRRTSSTAALPQANRDVSQSVMQMLRPELFDDVGILKSLWLHRFEMGTEKTDQLIDALSFGEGTSFHAKNKVTGEPGQSFPPHDPQLARWYF